MASQFLNNSRKVAAKAVADDCMRRLKLQAGDDVPVDHDSEVQRPAQRASESVAAGFSLLRGERARDAQPRLDVVADRVPAGVGERSERLGEAVDEAVDAGRVRQAGNQLPGDIDC